MVQGFRVWCFRKASSLASITDLPTGSPEDFQVEYAPKAKIPRIKGGTLNKDS